MRKDLLYPARTHNALIRPYIPLLTVGTRAGIVWLRVEISSETDLFPVISNGRQHTHVFRESITGIFVFGAMSGCLSMVIVLGTRGHRFESGRCRLCTVAQLVEHFYHVRLLPDSRTGLLDEDYRFHCGRCRFDSCHPLKGVSRNG